MSRDENAQYYDAGGIETLDIVKAKLTREQYIGYLLGTALVYQCRMMHKGQSLSDARKAANYSAWLAEELDRAKDIAEPEPMAFEWKKVEKARDEILNRK
jgi:hypothetical protein